MERSLRQLDSSVHWTHEATLDGLSRVISSARVAQVLQRAGASERRIRKLSLVLTVFVCIGMNLFADEAIDAVLRKLLAGARFLRPEQDLDLAGASAICQRRRQLGVRPMVALFHEVCKPLATVATRAAFRFGLRVMAIDGTVEDVADSPANARYFGRLKGSRGASAFPQIRCVYLCECGTHAICDAGVWPSEVDERLGGWRMLRSVGPGMLVMWDCGFHSYDMCVRCRTQGAQFLGRVPAVVRFTPIERLADGSYLAYLRPSDRHRRRQGERLLVRVIEYTVNDPHRPHHGQRHRLITSLCEVAQASAHALAVEYHKRWEVEIVIDETDTHQRRPLRPFRSRTPQGVLQEIYGLLLAHYLVRSLMQEAAQALDLAPDQLSFVGALRIIREAVFQAQIVAPHQARDWYHRLLRDIGREQLPQRANRSNPRVVKRKMSKFDLKREPHRHWPQPTKSFADAIVLLI